MLINDFIFGISIINATGILLVSVNSGHFCFQNHEKTRTSSYRYTIYWWWMRIYPHYSQNSKNARWIFNHVIRYATTTRVVLILHSSYNLRRQLINLQINHIYGSGVSGTQKLLVKNKHQTCSLSKFSHTHWTLQDMTLPDVSVHTYPKHVLPKQSIFSPEYYLCIDWYLHIFFWILSM